MDVSDAVAERIEETQETADSFASPDLVPQDCVEHVLKLCPAENKDRFGTFFRYLRRAYPQETRRAILRHLAGNMLDAFTSEAIDWLVATRQYLSTLVDPEVLSKDEALRVAKRMREADPDFFSHFASLNTNIESALEVLQGIGGHDPLVWWLYGLTRHPAERIRSKAAKMVCEIRPNTELIERQLQTKDSRVRANAIEALWPVRTGRADRILREALSDTSHRVVMNALVGLYFHGKQESLDEITKFAHHSSPLFQSAAAWALGHIGDQRGVPVLEELAKGRCSMVRKRAKASLEKLSAAPGQ